MRFVSLPVVLMTGTLLALSPACSQSRPLSSSAPVDLGDGATFVIKKVSGFDLKLVFFQEARYTLRVESNKERKTAKGLETLALETKATAACNGGYFTPQFGPVGLEIAGGVKTGEYDHTNLPFGGALAVGPKGARILRDDEFTDGAGITDLVQCCPRLMERGAAVKGIGGDDRFQRTFLLTDEAGHWALGSSNGIGLQELADLLATPGIITEFRIQRALNLDGGPSTGLWCRDSAGATHYQRESSPVRNIILLIPRKK